MAFFKNKLEQFFLERKKGMKNQLYIFFTIRKTDRKMTSMAALSLQNFKLLFFRNFFKILFLFYFILREVDVFLTFAQNELKLKLKKVWFFYFVFFMKLETRKK